MVPSHMTLGQKIRTLRKQLNMTQQDLAGDEFTKSFISQIEKDVAKPSLRSLQVIANRLNKPVGYFLDETQPNSDPYVSDKIFHLITLGQKLEANQLPQDALGYYQQALQELAADSHLIRARVLYLTARAAAQVQNHRLAIETYKQAASEFAAIQDLHAQARSQILAGCLLIDTGDFQSAEKLLRDAYRNLDSNEPDVYFWQIRVQSSLGLIYQKLNQPDQALACYLDSLELSIIHGCMLHYGDINRAIGLLYLARRELQKAEQYLTRARYYYLATGNEQNAARCDVHLARVLLGQGQKKEAARLVRQALAILQLWVYPAEAYTAYSILGETAEEAKDYSTAMSHLESAREYAQTPEEKAQLEIAVARLLRSQGRFNESIDHLLDLEEWIQNSDQPSLQASYYSELAESYFSLAEPTKAQVYMKKSLDLYRKLQG